MFKKIFKYSKKEIQLDYLKDYDTILKNFHTITEIALEEDSSKIIRKTNEEIKQMNTVYQLLNNYITTSNYMAVVIFNNNVKFHTLSTLMKNSDTYIYKYFSKNTFPIYLFKEELEGKKQIYNYVFSELFDIKNPLFFKGIDFEDSMEKALSKYNKKVLGDIVEENDLPFVYDIGKRYSFKQLLDFKFFRDVVYSITKTFVFENITESLEETFSEDIINLLECYLNKTFLPEDVQAFIISINTKKVMNFLFEIAEVLRLGDFKELPKEDKEQFVQNKLKELEPLIEKELLLKKENLKNIFKNKINSIKID